MVFGNSFFNLKIRKFENLKMSGAIVDQEMYGNTWPELLSCYFEDVPCDDLHFTYARKLLLYKPGFQSLLNESCCVLNGEFYEEAESVIFIRSGALLTAGHCAVEDEHGNKAEPKPWGCGIQEAHK